MVVSRALAIGETACPTIFVITEGGRLTPVHPLTKAAFAVPVKFGKVIAIMLTQIILRL